MNEREVSRLNNSQLLVLLGSEAFESDHERVRKVLLNRNGLDATVFETLHRESGCQMSSEFLYSLRSGFKHVDFLTELRVNMFIRRCLAHGVESGEFGELGETPQDWDGIPVSRRYSNSE